METKREALERDLKGLPLRKQRKILRDFDKGEGRQEDVEKILAKAEAAMMQHASDDEWDDDEEEDDEEFDDEEDPDGEEEEEEEAKRTV